MGGTAESRVGDAARQGRIPAADLGLYLAGDADKLALKVGQYNIGYLSFGSRVGRHSPANRDTKPNFSESFHNRA